MTIRLFGAVTLPPGPGLLTATLKFPPWATSVAGIAAVSDVEFTNVVTRAELFTRIWEAETKFAPVTVMLSAALPAGTLDGEILVTAGIGLLMVKVAPSHGLPLGFVTVTSGVPATATALAGMEADSCVVLTKFFVSATPLK